MVSRLTRQAEEREVDREVRFYSRVLSTGESLLWRKGDLMNNLGHAEDGDGAARLDVTVSHASAAQAFYRQVIGWSVQDVTMVVRDPVRVHLALMPGWESDR